MTSLPPSDEPLTPDDIRLVAFTQVKRGYDPDEVDSLLEQVAQSLSLLAAAAERPAPAAAAPAPLHDPEGAAQRLLAAAQRTADAMTADAEEYASTTRRDADSYAQQARSEADSYAQTTRGDADTYTAEVTAEADAYAQQTRAEADAHASAVTEAAESQAATIRAAATDEARRAAEEARAELVADLAGLQRSREALQIDVDALRDHLESQRSTLLESIDAMRRSIAEGDLSVASLPLAELDEATIETLAGASTDTAGAGSSEAPVADQEAVEHVDVGEVDEPEAVEEPVAIEDVDDEGGVETAADEPAPESDGATFALFEAGAEASDIETLDDELSSLFEAVPDEAADTDAPEISASDLSDDELSSLFEAVPDEAVPDADDDTGGDDVVSAAAASIFDIEAEEDLFESGPPTQAMPAVQDAPAAGDRFFAELSMAEPDDGLGPLDEDTDAALSAFFEPEEDDLEERWRNRFGPQG